MRFHALCALLLACLLAGAAAAVSTGSTAALHARTELRRTASASRATKGDVLADVASDAGPRELCVSWGDTHVMPFSGGTPFSVYNDELPFVLVRTTAPEWNPNKADWDRAAAVNMLFEVQAQQRNAGAWDQRTVDNDFAVRCGPDVVRVTNSRDVRGGGKYGGVKVTINEVDVTAKLRGPNDPPLKLPGSPDARNADGDAAYNVYMENLDGAAAALAKKNKKGGSGGDDAGSYFAHVVVDCNRGEQPDEDASKNTFVSGFRASISYRQHPDAKYVYGNIIVESQEYWKGRVEGACGWLEGGANEADFNRFRHWLLPVGNSLFGRAMEDPPVVVPPGLVPLRDTKDLDKQKRTCEKLVGQALGADVRQVPMRFLELDVDVGHVINGWVYTCALDAYYGVAHSPAEMKQLVCDWVHEAEDSIAIATREMERRTKACQGSTQRLQRLYDEDFELGSLCAAKGVPRRERRVINPDEMPVCPAKVTGGPKDQMKILSQNLATEIRGEQKAHDRSQEDKDIVYANKLGDNKARIEDKEQDIHANEQCLLTTAATIKQLKNKISSLHDALVAKHIEIHNTNDALEEGADQRSREYGEYVKNVEDTEDLVQLIIKIKEKMLTVKSQVFLQQAEQQLQATLQDKKTSAGVRRLASLVQQAVVQLKKTAASPVFPSLVEEAAAAEPAQKTQTTAAKADKNAPVKPVAVAPKTTNLQRAQHKEGEHKAAAHQKAVDEKNAKGKSSPLMNALANLCQMLIKECHKYLDELHTGEIQAKKDWASLKGDLQATLRTQTGQEADLSAELGMTVRNRVNDEQQEAFCQRQKGTFAQELKDLNAEGVFLRRELKDHRTFHTSETDRRNQELKTIGEVLHMLNAHQSSKHLKDRVNGVGVLNKDGTVDEKALNAP